MSFRQVVEFWIFVFFFVSCHTLEGRDPKSLEMSLRNIWMVSKSEFVDVFSHVYDVSAISQLEEMLDVIIDKTNGNVAVDVEISFLAA